MGKMYVARNFHFSILTSQVIDSHYRLVRDCRISPTMALELKPHNPFTIFADNDDFQDGLHVANSDLKPGTDGESSRLVVNPRILVNFQTTFLVVL